MRKLLALIGFIIVCNLHALESTDMTVVLDANEAPPFFSASMPHDGMVGEIIYEISKASNIKTIINYKPLSRMIEDDSNNDLGNPAFFINNQDFNSIIPIIVYHMSFYYYSNDKNKKHIKIESLHDLKGSKIGVLKGSLINLLFFKNQGIVFVTSYSQESLFKKLRLKRVDYVIEVEFVGEFTINKLFPSQKDNFKSIKIQSNHNPIAIMLAEDEKDVDIITKKYREGLEKIIENGTYQRVINKYFPEQEITSDWLKNLNKFKELYNFGEEL